MSRLDEPLYLGAYWSDRAEDASSCAERLARCLSAMVSVSAYLSGWRPKGRSQSEALASPAVAPTDLIGLLEAGLNRRDVDGSVIPELGMRWSAWNGNTALPASFSVTCGACATQSGVLNSFVLKLPEATRPGAEDIYGAADELLAGVVEAWEPEWAVLTSHELRESLGLDVGQPVVGWLTYLGSRRDTGGLGAGFKSGTLIRASDSWEGVAASDLSSVVEVLAEAGALRPIGS